MIMGILKVLTFIIGTIAIYEGMWEIKRLIKNQKSNGKYFYIFTTLAIILILINTLPGAIQSTYPEGTEENPITAEKASTNKKDNNTITIEKVRESFEKAGYTIDRTQGTPEINLTGAENVYSGYIDDEYIVFYEFKDIKEMESMVKAYPHYENNSFNKNWMMANGTDDKIKVFKEVK